MNQEWFEMAEIRRRRFSKAVWIPLRAKQKIESIGRYGYLGYREETFDCSSLAVPVEDKTLAEKIGLDKIGLIRHGPEIRGERYIPADIFEDYDGEFTGVPLVLEQPGNSAEPARWHLHQDLVIALHLQREDDTWLCFDEGYVEVARLHRGTDRRPILLEVRAAHLKDYLCARRMALYISTYRCRTETVSGVGHIMWPGNRSSYSGGGDRWEGRISEIHEGGRPVGSSRLVIHASRNDVDAGEDIPMFSPDEGNIVSKSWTETSDAQLLHLICGELWRNEWVDPAEQSPRIRGDELPPTVFFITDETGTRENRSTLKDGGRWLWFRPDVIMALAHRRGGGLGWYTKDTGCVWCSPDYDVAFGMNKIAMINVYAKDIAVLPEWQQQIWAGFSLSPEGGVADELLAAQAIGDPARTTAPEILLPDAIARLDQTVLEKFGFRLFREHSHVDSLLEHTHRFRSVDASGFFALAKDLVRLTAENIDASALQKKVPPPKNPKLGSLKSLENVIALEIGAEQAHTTIGPLFGLNDLRQADAHLPGSKLGSALKVVGVDQNWPFVFQGLQLLDICVTTLYRISNVLDQRGPDI